MSVEQAVRFLSDSRVQNFSKEQKEIFLKGKGLSADEIATALNQVAVSFPSSSVNFWSFVLSLTSFVAAMSTGALAYHIWQDWQKIDEPGGKESSAPPPREVEQIEAILLRQEQKILEQSILLRDIAAALAELQPDERKTRKPGSGIFIKKEEFPEPTSPQSQKDEVDEGLLEVMIAEVCASVAKPTVQMILMNFQI